MNWRDRQRSKRAGSDLNLTPLIDIVFLMLIYFLVAASFLVPEYDLPYKQIERIGSQQIDLDEPPPPEVDFQDVIVRVLTSEQQLSWSINDIPYPSLDAVRNKLDALAQQNASATVILDPEGNVQLGDVIDVFDSARAAGFDDVNFAATPTS